jgi:Domain of unknown function (DUF4271)
MIAQLKSFLLFGLCLFVLNLFGQKDNGMLKMDTTNNKIDSTATKDTLLIKYIPVLPKSYQHEDAWYIQNLHSNSADTIINILNDYKNYYAQNSSAFQLYCKNSVRANGGQIIYKIEQRYSLPDKDFLYYLLIGIILLYGLINNLFPQYYQKLFSQFSQSSLRMLQNREQLVQNTIASLASNINFVLSFSLMSTLLIFNRHLLPITFWQAYLYVIIFFLILYLGKYICLKLIGYIFNVKDLVNTYVFVVFLINKVLGILLLPFILILSFSKPAYYTFAILGAAILAILLFLYRYIFSLTSVRNKLHISSFHFFLYLCAFEILPLLILYKFIVQYLGGTY